MAERMSSKRKRVVLSIDSKLAILRKIKEGVPQIRLAEQYGVGRSTITDLKKNEDKIREFAEGIENQGISKVRKVMRLGKDEQLEEALYMWFVQKRGQGNPVSGPLLAEKAKQLHDMLHEGCSNAPSFTASAGWLWRFCKRHGIRQLSLEGEQLSSDECAVEPFQSFVQELIEEEGLTLEQIYNCDETGLYYRMLPDKTLAAKDETRAKGMKKQKERVTIMACSNATGNHKLPLVFLHKYENPHCFKHINKGSLPVTYYSQRNAWMDRHLFNKWFEEDFVPQVKKYLIKRGLLPKAILFLDNAPAHPDATTLTSSDKLIKAIFLPANTTALIQPMDQGVLEAMKRRYKKSLLRSLLMADNDGKSMMNL